MIKSLKKIFAQYGPIAVAVYLTLRLIVWVGAYLAITLGWTPKSVASTAGVLMAAYIVAKITQPLQIGATLLLTPMIGKMWEKRRGTRAA